MSANIVVAHPLARRVNNVHKLGVRGVQSVRLSPAVKERTGRVQAGYAANLPADKPALKGLFRRECSSPLWKVKSGAKAFLRGHFLDFYFFLMYMLID